MNTEHRKVGTKPFRIYYDQRLTQVDDIRKSIVRTVASWSHASLNETVYKMDSNSVEWRCFFCHTKTEIDIKKFDGKDMFCDDHRPQRLDDRFKKNPMFLRYINSFFSSIKTKIIENSKISNLYEQ